MKKHISLLTLILACSTMSLAGVKDDVCKFLGSEYNITQPSVISIGEPQKLVYPFAALNSIHLKCARAINDFSKEIDVATNKPTKVEGAEHLAKVLPGYINTATVIDSLIVIYESILQNPLDEKNGQYGLAERTAVQVSYKTPEGQVISTVMYYEKDESEIAMDTENLIKTLNLTKKNRGNLAKLIDAGLSVVKKYQDNTTGNGDF